MAMQADAVEQVEAIEQDRTDYALALMSETHELIDAAVSRHGVKHLTELVSQLTADSDGP